MSLYILEMYSEVKRNTRKIEVKRNTRKISSKSNSVPRLFFLLSSWLSDVSHLHSHFTQVSIIAHILVLWYSPSECFQKDIFSDRSMNCGQAQPDYQGLMVAKGYPNIYPSYYYTGCHLLSSLWPISVDIKIRTRKFKRHPTLASHCSVLRSPSGAR